MDTKKINELPILEQTTEETNILVEQNGTASRIPADKLSGADRIIANGTANEWNWEKWSSGKAVLWTKRLVEINEKGYAPPIALPFELIEFPVVLYSDQLDDDLASVTYSTGVSMYPMYYADKEQEDGSWVIIGVTETGAFQYTVGEFYDGDPHVPLQMYMIGKWR